MNATFISEIVRTLKKGGSICVRYAPMSRLELRNAHDKTSRYLEGVWCIMQDLYAGSVAAPSLDRPPVKRLNCLCSIRKEDARLDL